MCYDDHLYCERCKRHSDQCWCIRVDDDLTDLEEYPGGVCTEHDPYDGAHRGRHRAAG